MFGTLLMVLALLMALLAPKAEAQQRTYRDSMGRTTGTESRDSNGTRTFRDGMGRTTGTATRDSNGTITYRDSMGRIKGTSSR